jgi:hypothetical protein
MERSPEWTYRFCQVLILFGAVFSRHVLSSSTVQHNMELPPVNMEIIPCQVS